MTMEEIEQVKRRIYLYLDKKLVPVLPHTQVNLKKKKRITVFIVCIIFQKADFSCIYLVKEKL